MNFKKRINTWLMFVCVIFIFILMLDFVQFAEFAQLEQFNQIGPDKDNSYVLGPKDLLTISVFDVPELNISVRVSEDGTITLPLLGQIEVNGLTLLELERQLASLLEKSYLKNAQVTIFIKEYQSRQVSIIGAVSKPGNYELIGKQTLLQVLSRAGGLTKEVGDRVVIIRRNGDGTSQSLAVSVEDLMITANPGLNMPIFSDDIINVPVAIFTDIYIFGQVNHAGQLKMKKDESLTLLRAIAQAGGFTERARSSGVVIKRIINNKEEKIQVNVNKIISGKKKDIMLNPNDIVYVPESIL